MDIRKVILEDIDELMTIGKQTFIETYSAHNSEENMLDYLKTEFAIEKLTAELKNLDSEFYFAEIDGKVIGYLKVSSEASQTETTVEKALQIERIYVRKEFHGKKVGQILYNKAGELANDKKLKNIWLGVWEENKRAIRFYEKNGFVAFDKHIFKLGNDYQTDILMKLQLKKN